MLAILIGGLFAFLFTGLLLAVFLGAQRVEEELKERAREAVQMREQATRVPRFFMVNRAASPRVGPLDEAMLWQVQQYLDAEQTMADEFVLQPSVESLYRESGRRIVGH